MENEVIVDQWSPIADIEAFVEKSNKNYYFYLWIDPEGENPKIRACWICNRMKAPRDVEEAFACEGEAPCMPEEFVGHDPNGIELDEEALTIQWFEEGDAAALLMGDKVISVIPCFAGYKGFCGYSVYAKGTGPFAWELKGAYDKFEQQVLDSAKFWDYFEEEGFWGKVQDYHMEILNNFFGEYEKYYAIDGGEFPPKALVQERKNGNIYGITLGVSMIPMPKVEMGYEDDYKDYRRMELGFACKECHEPLMESMYSTMSGLSAYPWKDLTFLGHGHTIPFKNIKGFDYLLFLNSRMLPEIPAPKYMDFMDEKVNLLWLKPITEAEQKEIADKGVTEYLKEKDLSMIHIFG